jgi:HEAT repeat protein
VDPLVDLGQGGEDRIEEVGPPAPVPPQDVAEVFSALDKAVRAQRLYQSNNPVYRGFIEGARRQFAGLWGRLQSLTAGVEEHAFRWYGREFPAGESRDSLPFLFYKDGIRFITFLPGFEEDLERFLDVINLARTQDQRGGDDMVTLLWQQDFSSFQYSYIDALAEGLHVPQSQVPKLVGLELTLVQQDAASPAAAGSLPSAMEAGQPSVAGLINREDFEETLYFLEPAELARLSGELEQEWSRDVKADVLAALFDRLEQGLPEWRSEILRILRQMLPAFLGGGDLHSATTIVVELNRLVETDVLEGEHREDAVALFRELSEPVVLNQLMRSLEDGSIDPSGTELGVFLRHLAPTAMPVLLTAIEQSGVPALQARLGSAIDELAGAHRDELLPLLRSPDELVLRGAARVAGRLGISEATPALVQLLTRPDPALRLAAIEALVRLRNAQALDALQKSLEDSDRDVRITAARGLAALRYAPARERLEQMIDGRIVREADLTEMIAFFEAYGAVANESSVAVLDRILNGRRLLGKESAERRACAAMALGHIGSAAARAALERASGETNPVIRNAVIKALRAGGA